MSTYRRYLSDKNFREAVNKLHDVYEEWMMAEYDRMGGDEKYGMEEAKEVHDGWLEACAQAEQMVHEGGVALDDKQAAENLPGYERWLKERSPEWLELQKIKTPMQ